MLRKMRSHAFLSPKKAALPSQPATSPIRAYAVRSSSPTKSFPETDTYAAKRAECVACHEVLSDSSQLVLGNGCGHRYHLQCAKQQVQCPICPKSPRIRMEKARRIRRKASSWFGLTPVKQVVAGVSTQETRSGNMPFVQILQSSLHSEFHCVCPETRELLCLLHIQSTLSTLQQSHLESTANRKNVVLVLDSSPALQSVAQLQKLKEAALLVIEQLSSQDILCILSTVAGSDECRIVCQDESPLFESRQSFSGAISNMVSKDDSTLTDLCSTFAQATSILKQQPNSGRLYLIFLSDGLARPSNELFWRLPHTTRTLNITLHTFGVGAVIDGLTLRRLAHCSTHGTYLLAADTVKMISLLSHMARNTYSAPLENINVDIKLYEGASVRELRHTDIDYKVLSPQHIELLIPRLGLYESYQVMFVILLPQTEPRRALNTGQNVTPLQFSRKDHITLQNSFGDSDRLAELEEMVNRLPSRLASCKTHYRHPLFHELSRVHDPETSIMIKRCYDRANESADYRVTELAKLQEVQSILIKSQHIQYERLGTLGLRLLDKADSKIREFLDGYETSSSRFADLLETINHFRHRAAVQEHGCSRAIIKGSSSDCKTGEIFSALPQPDVRPRIVKKASVIALKPCPDGAELEVNQDSSTPERLRERLDRPCCGSAGSVSSASRSSLSCTGVATPIEACNQVWTKPNLKRLPTSQEVQSIISHATSKHQRERPSSASDDEAVEEKSMPQSPQARLVDFLQDQQRLRQVDQDDYAQRIWNSHKEERGESSMLSEDEIRLDLDNLQREDLLTETAHDTHVIDSPHAAFSKGSFKARLTFLPKLNTGIATSDLMLEEVEYPHSHESTAPRMVRFTTSTTAVDNDQVDTSIFPPLERPSHNVCELDPTSSRYSSIPDVQSPAKSTDVNAISAKYPLDGSRV